MVSLSSLGYEIILTRIFSISTGSHFAFLIISIALLGYGASGTFLWLFRDSIKRNSRKILSEISLALSVSITTVHILTNWIQFDPAIIHLDGIQMFYLVVYLILVSSVFFLSGLIIAFAFSCTFLEPGKIYFADMSGAGIGCVFVLLLLAFFTPEKVVLLYSLTALFASIIFSGKSCMKHMVILGSILVLFVLNPAFIDIHISPFSDLSTALRYEDSHIVYTAYNSYSRIDVVDSPAVRFAPGLSIKYMDELPEQRGITVDAGELSALILPESLKQDFLDHLPSSIVYFLNDEIENLLIVEPGGGADILTGLLNGAKNVDALYENSLLCGYVSGFYNKNTDFDFSGVNFTAGQTRAFLNKKLSVYDLVILPVTNPLGASSGFSSGEDYLFTREAFIKYYMSLKKDGYLCYTGYLNTVPIVEARVFNTFLDTAASFEGTYNNLIAIRSMNTITIILKKGNYTNKEIASLKEFTQKRNFDICFYPKMKAEEANIYNRYLRPLYHEMFKLLTEDSERFIKEYPFDISVVTDDSPFFNNYFPVKKLPILLKDPKVKWSMLLEGGYLTPLISVICFVLSFLIIFLPVLIKKKVNYKPDFRLLFYILIGIGYMAVEVALIHKFIMLFGNVVYSVSIILFFMLISSGTGSMFSSIHMKNDRIGLFISLICAGAILLLYSFINPIVIELFQDFSIFPKIILTGLYILPLGFVLGIPFPTGIRIIKRQRNFNVPLMFCANSQAGVVSSCVSMVIASMTGYSMVIFLTGVIYIVSSAVAVKLLKYD